MQVYILTQYKIEQYVPDITKNFFVASFKKSNLKLFNNFALSWPRHVGDSNLLPSLD